MRLVRTVVRVCLAKRVAIGGWLLVEVVVLCSWIFKDMVIIRYRQQGIVAKGCFQRKNNSDFHEDYRW